MDGDQCRELERQFFTSADNFTCEFSDLKADVFDRTAIATMVFDFESQIGDDSQSMSTLLTFVLVKVGDDWKISHESFSPIAANP